MNYNQQLQQYVKRNVDGANQGDLILLLYDAGINAMHMGKAKMDKKDIEGVHNALVKAILILEELISSLNMEKGGEISKNLLSLYMYAKRRLTDSNRSKDPTGIDEAIIIMDELRDAWRAALAQDNHKSVEKDQPQQGEIKKKIGSPQPETGASPKSLNISV